MTSPLVRLVLWALTLGALLLLSTWRLQPSYDLGLFLPAPQTAEQRLLVERLGESPGSRFIMMAVPDDSERVMALAERLRTLPGVDSVRSLLAGL